jgi:hypothetical protein
MGRGDTFAFYGYQSDDTNTYAVKLSSAVATQGGFTTTVDPTSTPVWPYHSKNLRHAWGRSGVYRTKLPIAKPDSSKYISGGEFTLGGVAYTIEGIIGEKRKLNSVA